MADTLEAAIEFVLRAGMPCPVDRTYTALANVLGAVTSPAIDVAIITVNYDICADIAIYSAGRRPYYCLDPSVGAGPDEIALAKLHGSLNWHGCTGVGCGYVNAEPHIDEAAPVRLEHEPEGSRVHMTFRSWYTPTTHKCGHDEQQPLIVPPVENKSHYYGDMRVVWNRAESELRGAEQLLIAGYSFRSIDLAVNNLLLASLAARPIRVMIADPLQEVRERIAGQLAAANPRVRIEEQLSAELALESLSL